MRPGLTVPITAAVVELGSSNTDKAEWEKGYWAFAFQNSGGTPLPLLSLLGGGRVLDVGEDDDAGAGLEVAQDLDADLLSD